MDTVSLKPDFATADNYRLLAMDGAWVAELKKTMRVTPVSAGKRPRQPCAVVTAAAAESPPHGLSVVLVMKGDSSLCASDATETLLVRRVEYSNTLLIAERRPRAGSTESWEQIKDGGRGDGATSTLARVRDVAENVVVSSQVRMFEVYKAAPQQNILELLRSSHIPIEELEGVTQHAGSEAQDEGSGGGTEQRASLFTFPALVTRHSISPRELAAVLSGAGAIVHHGYVRLLEPTLLHMGLCSVLAYLSSADPSEMSWQAVEEHLCPSALPQVVVGAVRSAYGAPNPAATAVEDGADVEELGVARLLDVGKVLVGLAGAAFESPRCAAVAQAWDNLPHGVRAVAIPFDAFYTTWRESLPDAVLGRGAVPPRDAAAADFVALLSGFVVYHCPRKDSFDGATAWWLPRDEMPNDIQKRLDVLFAIRDGKYTADVVRAYVQPLLAPDQAFAHVILRYAREYRVPGEPVMYSRLAA